MRLTMCGLCVMIRSKHELVDSVILVAEFVSWKSWCTFRMSIRCCDGLLKKSPSIKNLLYSCWPCGYCRLSAPSS